MVSLWIGAIIVVYLQGWVIVIEEELIVDSSRLGVTKYAESVGVGTSGTW